MPSLDLLFELADRSSTSRNFEVSLNHAHQAAAFCRYLESHARRIYSCIATPRVNAARELAARIKEGDLGREFTCRDGFSNNKISPALLDHGASFVGLQFIGATLYGAAITQSGGASTLRTLNPSSGASVTVGATGIGPISGLAYNGATLYGFSGGGAPSKLYTLNLGTGPRL